MKLILKPLFEAELPGDFVEVLRQKLRGREIKDGETIDIDLLGKPLRFKVLYSEPKILRVRKNTQIEILSQELSIIKLDLGSEAEDLLTFRDGFIVVFDDEVLILNHNGHKIYKQKFENLKKVNVVKNTVAVLHGKELTLITLP